MDKAAIRSCTFDQRSAYDRSTTPTDPLWCADANASASMLNAYAFPTRIHPITLENRLLRTRICARIPPRPRSILVTEIGTKGLTATIHRSTIRIPSRTRRHRELHLLFLSARQLRKAAKAVRLHAALTASSSAYLRVQPPHKIGRQATPPLTCGRGGCTTPIHILSNAHGAPPVPF